MNDLPPGWATARLEDVAEVILGQSPPGRSYNTLGEGLPFFQGKAEFGKLHPEVRKWTTEPKKLAVRGDILLSVRAPVGPTNIAPTTCAIGRGLHAIRPVDEMNRDFVLWSLRSSVDRLIRSSTGSTFAAVTGNQVKTHEIRIAPASEQIRIVERIQEVFTRLDDAESMLKSFLNKLNILRSAVLDDAFHLNRILPVDWNRVTLESAVTPRKGKVIPNAHDSRPYLSLDNIQSNNCNVLGWNKSSDYQSQSSRLFPEDVAYSRLRPYLNKVVTIDRESLGSAEFIVLPRSCSLLPKFLALLLSARAFVEYANNNSTGDRPRLNWQIMKHYEFGLPTIAEQRCIVESIESTFSHLNAIEESVNHGLCQVTALRQSMLAEAFAGRLVPQDPDDEPASVLLKRITASRPAKPKRRRKARA